MAKEQKDDFHVPLGLVKAVPLSSLRHRNQCVNDPATRSGDK